jgi:hypothetical protein
MYKLSALAALAGSVCLLSGAVTFDDQQQKTFPLTGAGERKLIVENIQGHIRVTGDSGNAVRISLKEHWSAGSQQDLDQGRQEVKLTMTQTGNVVKIGLDGPFRERRHVPDYRFRHEYEIQVPKDVAVELKSVNGEVSATGLSSEVAHLKTVNGKVTAKFDRNPARASAFETVNGAIDVTLQSGLNAELKLSTLNGGVYTDFEVQALTTPVSMQRSADGHRFRLDRDRKVRVGSGGIEHSFKTVNGTIKIRKQ